MKIGSYDNDLNSQINLPTMCPYLWCEATSFISTLDDLNYANTADKSKKQTPQKSMLTLSENSLTRFSYEIASSRDWLN